MPQSESPLRRSAKVCKLDSRLDQELPIHPRPQNARPKPVFCHTKPRAPLGAPRLLSHPAAAIIAAHQYRDMLLKTKRCGA